MRHTKQVIVAAAAALVLACSSPDEPEPSSEPRDAPRPGPAPSIEELAGATFTGIEDAGPVTLRSGKWEGEPFEEGSASIPTVWLTEDFYLTGDVDADGVGEAVAHLTYSTSGSGNFGFLAIMSRDDGKIVQRAVGALGDRVQIRDARVEGANVVLDVLQPGPRDGMCCPTELATRTFAVRNGQLVETATDVTGSASLASLEGTEWVLRKPAWDEHAPSEPELTLLIDSGRVSGSSGCNSYSGSVELGETATAFAIGPLLSTRKACPPEIMNLEQRYTAALQRAGNWGFRFRRLVISYGEGEDFGSLVFEGREPPKE